MLPRVKYVFETLAKWKKIFCIRCYMSKGYRGRVEPYISEFCQMYIAFVTFFLLSCFLTSKSGIDETCWEW